MNTYFISLENMVAVQAESEEQAREAAKDTFVEILQRDTDVVLEVELENTED